MTLAVDQRLGPGPRPKRRAPVILQTEGAECGLACIAMIAAYYGHDVDLAGLRTRFSVSLKGTTLVDLIRIASALDFSARPLRVELEHLGRLKTPCVLHWDLKHFVVLVSVDSKSVEVHDPGVGHRRLTLAEASRGFSGIALELQPTPEFSPQQARRPVRLKHLMGSVLGFRSAAIQVLGLALALEIFALFSPLLMQWTVDQAIAPGDRNLIGALAIGFLMLGFIQVGIGFVRGWTVMRLGTALSVQWMSNVFAHLIRLPISYFEKRHLGDVTSRFGSVDTIQRTLTSTFVEAILDGLMASVVLAVMLLYDTKLSLITLASVAVYASVRIAMYQLTRRLIEEQIACSAKQQSVLFESIRGIQSIKLFNDENGRHTRWVNLLVETTNRSLRAQQLGLYSRSLNALLFTAENVAVIFFGANAVLDGTMSLGMLFAFIAYKTTFATRVSTLIDRSVDLFMLRVQSERLADIVLTPRENTAETCHENVRGVSAKIEVRNLSFRYSDNEPLVLDDVSFEIEAGEAVALTGPSGCGKTTLVKLMLGLLSPTSGDILVDGVSIFGRSPGSYRRSVAAVMQDDQLFAGTIQENITFFDPQSDTNEVERCAKAAAVHDDIRHMPMQYNTLVGDMGSALSGGQKQRVLLARALYKQPRLLFLDEATSHLDLENERLVNDSIRRLALTRVIIAHRPETLVMADRTIVLCGRLSK